MIFGIRAYRLETQHFGKSLTHTICVSVALTQLCVRELLHLPASLSFTVLIWQTVPCAVFQHLSEYKVFGYCRDDTQM